MKAVRLASYPLLLSVSLGISVLLAVFPSAGRSQSVAPASPLVTPPLTPPPITPPPVEPSIEPSDTPSTKPFDTPEATIPLPPNAIPPVVVELPDLPTLGDSSQYLPSPEYAVHLVLKLGQRRVFVHEGEKVVASYPVAIGRPDAPTPTGEFKVFEMVINPVWQSPWTGEVESPGPDGSLGLRWIGFTTRSNGVIGFHGTPNVRSIGQAASSGCVRMRNEDVVELFEQVEVGTVVRVEP